MGTKESDEDGDVVAILVGMATEELSDEECFALHRAISLQMPVRRVKGYEKVADLFTEAEGTRMEQATWDAFQQVYQERLAQHLAQRKETE